jgi:hypothetical protein
MARVLKVRSDVTRERVWQSVQGKMGIDVYMANNFVPINRGHVFVPKFSRIVMIGQVGMKMC